MLFNIIKSVILGIIQGITEWLPISSTAHLILVQTFLPLNVYTDAASNTAFWDMYKVVIQFGSILAVLLVYWKKLWPFSKDIAPKKQRSIFRLWILIIIASVPAAIVGLALDDLIDSVLSSAFVIAFTLILYGVLFIWMENREHTPRITSTGKIKPMDALKVGAFQMLALIPGTSRSGATIFGATMLGFDRPTAAEFSFYMAIPVMFGASLLKVLKAVLKGMSFTGPAMLVLLVGTVVSFAVSLVCIRFLLSYIRKHDFKVFGYYRIVLGVIIAIACLFHVV